MAGKLVDMVESPKEQPRVMTGMPMDYGMDNKPSYPWGLCINLNEDSLEKLNMEKLPEIGSVVEMRVMAKVTSVSANANEDKNSHSVSLQITHMEVPGGASEEEGDDAAEEDAEVTDKPLSKKLYK